MMLRGRSRAVAKQTLAADHRSHSQSTPTQNLQQQNPPPLSRFLSKFRQISEGNPRTPFFDNTPSSYPGRRRSWELGYESSGVSLVVAAAVAERSKLMLFGPEIRVRTGDPSSDDPAREPNTPAAAHITEANGRRRRRRESKREESFLSSCYTCKKIIEPTEDIYIYRGEKAFCSGDCRHREILQDTAHHNIQDY